MPQSFAAVYLHAVFSTKDRAPYLAEPGLRRDMHAYLVEVSKRLECPMIEIGGVEDHIHALVKFSRTTSIADWMRETKKASSAFGKSRLPSFGWQQGYGVFSVDERGLDAVRAYIQTQEDHHRKVSFQDEFRRILIEHGLEWDERYIWD
jgi:putative transposase